MALGGGSSGGIRQLIELVGSAEVKAAFDKIGTSGEAAFSKLTAAANKASASFDRQTVAHHNVELGLAKVGGELTQTTQKMQIFANLTGSLTGGLAALFAFEGALKLKEGIAALIEPFNELRKTSAAFKLDPATITAFGGALREAGGQSSGAAAALTKFGGVVSDAQKNVSTLNNNLFPTVSVLKGTEGAATDAAASVTTMRGAIKEGATDVSNSVQTMRAGVIENLNATGDVFERNGIKFARDLPFEKAIEVVAGTVAKLGNNIRAVDLREFAAAFNQDDITVFVKTLAIINEKGFKGLKADAENLPPTAEDNARLAAYNAEVAKSANAWTAVKETIGAAFVLPAATTSLVAIQLFAADVKTAYAGIGTAVSDTWKAARDAFVNAGLLGRSEEDIAKLRELWTGFGTFFTDTIGPALSLGWTTALDLMSEALKTFLLAATSGMQSFTEGIVALVKGIPDALASTFSWIVDKISSLVSSLGGLLGAASGAPGGNLEGFAGGGHVRGPGSGTSDSILARLSDGEFVMKARAVDHWGPQFMASLNALRNPFAGFNLGGMVDAMSAPLMPQRMPRFATGGLVTAMAGGSDGSPVHLHLGGHEFRLRGPKDTVNDLIYEARKSNFLSAGRRSGF